MLDNFFDEDVFVVETFEEDCDENKLDKFFDEGVFAVETFEGDCDDILSEALDVIFMGLVLLAVIFIILLAVTL